MEANLEMRDKQVGIRVRESNTVAMKSPFSACKPKK